ncbi:MAG: hypothetical protein CPDRYMAC_6901 [uncultured Paraburkholderia sp.]|nr:MAG: hypothetical protein CPDRYDRY_6869 [uncultured Paraburkholderia sp.]CAH2945513.1 MAG: hypothetical protein CPDRYMAC_6901 [uncultured Paraburkholderia sp.]
MSIDVDRREILRAYRIHLASSKDDLQQIFRLRHQVFAEELHWVPQVNSGLEKDRYDTRATLIGILDSDGSAIGTIRILFKLIHSCLSVSLLPYCPTGQTAPRRWHGYEESPNTPSGLGRQASQALFYAAYRVCLSRNAHQADFVSTPEFVHSIRERGFPCVPFSNIKTLSGGVRSVAARMVCIGTVWTPLRSSVCAHVKALVFRS